MVGDITNIESAGSIISSVVCAADVLGVPGKSAIIIELLVEELNRVPVSNAHFDSEDSVALAGVCHHSLVATRSSGICVSLFSQTTAFVWRIGVDEIIE